VSEGVVAYVRIVTAGALQLAGLQGHQRLHSGTAVTDVPLGGRIPQLAVGQRQGAVVSEGDGMIVGQVHAQVPGESRLRAGADGHAAVGGGAGERNAHIRRAVGHVHRAQRQGTVVTGETQDRVRFQSGAPGMFSAAWGVWQKTQIWDSETARTGPGPVTERLCGARVR
jgi:hypothetical protein